jgi:hypothetical protein
VVTGLERRHDRLVFPDRTLQALPRHHVAALGSEERLPHDAEHLQEVRIPATGREAAVELVVGLYGRRGVTGGVPHPLVGGPQGGDRLRIERWRLPNRDALEDQHGRDELAQLGRIEQVGLAQMLGDRLEIRIARRIHGE